SDPLEVGDEPVLLAKHLNCPIAVSPKRTEAVAMLSEADDLEAPLDIIISDDGLQHFAMARDIEIALIDGQRGLGNELCMPAGPLREPKQRLKEVDFVVSNGQVCQDLNDAFRTKATVAEYETMRLMPVCFRNVAEPHRHLAADAFYGQSVNAMAGIGNPSRFYQTLKNLGMTLQTKDFADHQSYRPQDFEWVSAENETLPQKPLVMTEKDAVKCQAFAQENWWYLEVKPVCSPEFANRLLERINDLRSQVLNQQKVG
ncbi:MAG: tetraacyldisaccharide 4'-kinase, partial [Hydrogenovibrio sp.]|nr:tetraacyldisaccharide 4'-kinase [Hydrogenovibrio sp.]